VALPLYDVRQPNVVILFSFPPSEKDSGIMFFLAIYLKMTGELDEFLQKG